jgi:glutamate carboxypeptidase
MQRQTICGLSRYQTLGGKTMKNSFVKSCYSPLICLLLTTASLCATAQTKDEALFAAAAAAHSTTVQTLEKLVNIETGSANAEGLAAMGQFLESELRDIGAVVTRHKAAGKAVGDNIVGRIGGNGGKHFLLMAHMDTVYPKGALAKTPFRIDGPRAFGPGVADAKGGIAVILHTLRLLKTQNFKEFGSITVLFNTDEETGSFGSRDLITALSRESDYVFSYEPTIAVKELFTLAASGASRITTTIKGRAAHAGNNPEAGINALVEAADLVLRTQDLDDKTRNLRFNWTLNKAGTAINVIPDEAVIEANVRYGKPEDLTELLDKLKERIAKKRLPEASIVLNVGEGRPPFIAGEAGKRLIERAVGISKTLGIDIGVIPLVGGSTDAGYATHPHNAVIEGMGLPGFGYHSSQAEFAMIDAIPRRLYLSARMLMDLGSGK